MLFFFRLICCFRNLFCFGFVSVCLLFSLTHYSLFTSQFQLFVQLLFFFFLGYCLRVKTHLQVIKLNKLRSSMRNGNVEYVGNGGKWKWQYWNGTRGDHRFVFIYQLEMYECRIDWVRVEDSLRTPKIKLSFRFNLLQN